MLITDIRGIGQKKNILFNRLGIYDTEDLLRFYPRTYEVYEKPLFIAQLNAEKAGSIVSVEAVVSGKPGIYRAGRFSVVTVIVRDEEGKGIKCKWYNAPYIGTKLKKGMRFVFRGMLSFKNNEFAMEQPKMISPGDYDDLEKKLLPVYSLTKGLSQNAVRAAVEAAFEAEDISDMEYLPEKLTESIGVPERSDALLKIHRPETKEDVRAAAERLKFDEFFLFSLSVITRKKQNEDVKTGYAIKKSQLIDKIIKGLPYELTKAQTKALEQITADMESDAPMSRLLQGDVGSGKTIVAALALFNTVFAGHQAALMAPTEVLAAQEYKEITALIESFGLDIQAELLMGSLKQSEKKKIYARMISGEAGIIVGTHALFQAAPKYKDLGLIIIDEQHRFGVGQRRSLEEKSADDIPNILVMSATPIPRTLAWIIYGDLDISVIDELPAGRKPIKNAVVDTGYRPKAYSFIKKKISEGRQIYVICPMIERGEGYNGENVTDYAEILKGELGSVVRIGIMHGQLPPEEKQEVMELFAAGELDVLVSTTVIEVGVNVPNATVMMIENSERFGLSQLHQLRGRVGRGSEESYCIFVSDNERGDTKERLEIMAATNDGFVIAEKDLELRGPGDFFGFRQSGDIGFTIGDPAADRALLEKAVRIAGELLEADPGLKEKENAGIREEMVRYRDGINDRVSL